MHVTICMQLPYNMHACNMHVNIIYTHYNMHIHVDMYIYTLHNYQVNNNYMACVVPEEVRHPRVKENVLDTHFLGQSLECVC